MPEMIAIDLSPTLAQRISLMRMVEQRLLAGGGGELSYAWQEDRVTVRCSVTTAFELVHELRRIVFDSETDRDYVVACGAVVSKLNAALDTALNTNL